MRFLTYLKEDELMKWREYVKKDPMLKAAVELLADISKRKYSAYIVGGAVRDLILGTSPKDVDIATNMPMAILSKTYKTIDIGKSKDFGIVIVKKNSYDFEVAQFRQDGKYLDGRRPESVSVTPIFHGDASRRDLTINAMGIDRFGNIIDYFNGQKDIKNKVIKTVGNPEERFSEDYLRMLRTIRFTSRLGFDLDGETEKAIKKQKLKINHIAIERVHDELVKVASLSGDKFADAIILMDKVGVLEVILPEIVKMKEFEHNADQHPEGNVFQHTLAALKKNRLKDPIVNLAILFHDVGKTLSHTKDGDRHKYLGHAKAGVDLINNIADRLKLTNKEREAILFAAINHMKMHDALKMKPSKIVNLVNNDNWEVLKAVSYCDDACRMHLFDPKHFEKVVFKMEEIKKKWGQKTANKTEKIVDGKRVMKLTGLRPGPKVGEIISRVTDHVIDNNVKSDKEIDEIIVRIYYEI